MPFNPVLHNRHSIRLQGYEYTQSGAYFVTINTYKKEHLFGEVVNGVVQLSQMGEIAYEQWLKIPTNIPHILLDAFVVMPNHIHGIVVITEKTAVRGKGKAFDHRFTQTDRTSLNDWIKLNDSKKLGSNALPIQKGSRTPMYHKESASPTDPNRLGSSPGSLPAIIQNYKSITSRRINKLLDSRGSTIWHRNYYEHIIRDEEDYSRIVSYIQQNPKMWKL